MRYLADGPIQRHLGSGMKKFPLIHIDTFLRNDPLPPLPGFACECPVYAVWLENASSDYFRFLRNISFQRRVYRGKVRIFRCVDDWLPAFGRKIFCKFHPSLHAGSAHRRPVICNDKHPFHSLQIYIKDEPEAIFLLYLALYQIFALWIKVNSSADSL